MKIAFLLSSLYLSGGAIVVVEYANRLSQRGHSVTLVIPKDAISEELRALIGAEVHLVQADLPLKQPTGLWGKLKLTWALSRAVPYCDVIVTTHTPTSVVALIASKWMHKGKLVWFYMDYPGMFAERPAEAWLLKNAMRWHAGALVLSTHSAEELGKFSNKGIQWVGLGLSYMDVLLDAQKLRQTKGKSEKKAILYLGDFRPRKGLSDFLAAAEKVYRDYPEIELWIALKEPGTIQSDVPHRIIQRPSIHELAALYATCDLFVSASWYEGFGLPPLEAMLCGAPVVMSDSGGVRDFARPGENCLLVPTRTPEAMAQAMLKVLRDPLLAEIFSTNGRQTAQEFTWEKAARRFESALQDWK